MVKRSENSLEAILLFFQISTIFGAAFLHAATMPTAISGFKKTGIWPSDLYVFTGADYLLLATTDIQLENSECFFANTTDGQSQNSTSDSPVPTELLTKKTPALNPSLNVHGSQILQTFILVLRKSVFQTSPEALTPIPLIK